MEADDFLVGRAPAGVPGLSGWFHRQWLAPVTLAQWEEVVDLDETAFGACMMHALWAYDCDLNPGLRPNGATQALWSCLSDVKSCAEVDAIVFGNILDKDSAVSKAKAREQEAANCI